MTLSFFSCSRSVLLCSIIILGVFFLFGQISITHAATPIPPTLTSPASTWNTAITTSNVKLTWSYTTLDPSIWFYIHILKWDSSALTWKPYLSKYVGVTTQDSETFTDGFYAWQLAAVDISQQSNPWYQWANDWNKLKVGAGATPTPTPTPTPGGSPTPTPTPCPTCPTYYISPNGLDTNPGTSPTSPLKTFSKAIPLLKPGYTLILADGTYTKSTTGLPSITCGTNAQNGTASSYITIKAQNERKAFLQGDGITPPVLIQHCAYWNVEGLHAESQDNVASYNNPQAFLCDYCNNIVFKRNIGAHANRWGQPVVFSLYHSSYVTFEENEAYYYTRYGFGIGSYYNDHTIMRRNYSNARGYPSLKVDSTGHCNDSYKGGSVVGSGVLATQAHSPQCPTTGQCWSGATQGSGVCRVCQTGDFCGYPNGNPNGGDGGVIMYDSDYGIAENNISEGGMAFFNYANWSSNVGNRFYGNIELNNSTYGYISGVGGNASSERMTNVYYENNVAINAAVAGFYCNTCQNAQFTNNSDIGSGANGFLTAYNPNNTSIPSAYFTNNLSTGNATYGFSITGQNAWGIDFANSFANSNNYSTQSSGGNITNSIQIDSKLGACMVYLPTGSPMKGKGKNGADIGANIIYRYQNGVLTTQKLWNQTTGQFSCGVIVSGLNDVAGSSCFDVNKRLNVGYNGCSIP